ncbi:MAG TPA: alpha/beta hydrolase [Chitinophaga sp.]
MWKNSPKQNKCPLLVIQGEKDEYASRLIIPAIGHTPHKEAAAVVLERSAAFTTIC